MGQVAQLARQPVATAVRSHPRAWRPHTMPYVGLVGLAGALLTDRSGSTWQLCGAWLVPTLGWVAGHCGGRADLADLADRRTGQPAAARRRVRVLSGLSGWSGLAGRLSGSGVLAGVCIALAAVVACLLNWRTVFLAAPALGVAYGTRLERSPVGHLAHGGLSALVLAFGAMAVRAWPPVPLLAVAAVFWLHDSASSRASASSPSSASREAEGDAVFECDARGARPRRGAATAVAALMCVLWLGLATAAPLPLSGHAADTAAYWTLLGAVAVLLGVALVALVRAPRPVPPRVVLRAQEVLALERAVLACAFVGLSAGLPTALCLAVPATVLTALLQESTRPAYGFGPDTADRGIP